MQAPHRHELLSRVVAWHNRHPLARRIDATQVHSLGVVLLPFASAEPMPVVDDECAACAPAVPAPLAIDDLAPDSPRAAVELEIEIDIDLLGGHTPSRADAPGTEAGVPPAAPPRPGLPPVAPAPAEASAARRPAGLRRLLATLCSTFAGRHPGTARLQPVFSGEVIGTLTPAQLGRWARRRGQPRTLAPADWPRRRVAADAQRVAEARQAGLPHAVQLHLLGATISVAEQHLHLLMDAQGAVIGRRALSRARLTGAAALTIAGVLVLGRGLAWPGIGDDGDGDRSVRAAWVAPPAATAPTAIPISPSSLSPVPRAAAASADPTTAASAPDSGSTTPVAAPQARYLAPALAPARQAAPAALGKLPTQPLARIRPTLSADQRQAARRQAEQLRAAPVAIKRALAPARDPTVTVKSGPLYAVVSRPSRERHAAARSLALMRASSTRLPPPLPQQGELMRSQGEWRATWWPFTSLADAERARLLLASRGLMTEVVEF